MAKPKNIPFTQALENVLVNIWGSSKDHLDDSLIRKTWEALVEIRGIYRFKGDYPGKYPSSIQYRLAKNRAGYLAAFGQRHAYLTYAHLKRVQKIKPELVPAPEDRNGKIVVTLLGAGAAIETYGICYFYNELSQRLHKLHLNLVEKVDAWKPNRHTVFDKVLKGTFPKLDIFPTDIDADLTTDCIPKFANYYDKIWESDFLLIYNVMNEIHSKYARMVWRNVDFIIKVCGRPLLVLVMEPSVPKARPRIDWLKAQLAQRSEIIHEGSEEEFLFDTDPLKIDFEGTNIGLNDRLFGQTLDGSKPVLQRSLKRTYIACRIKPNSPVSIEQVQKQLAMLNLKRDRRGRFVRQVTPQKAFWDEFPDWGKTK